MERATSLENMEDFHAAHIQYAAEGQSEQCSCDSSVKHHFIAFVQNAKGQMVELDGLKDGPRVIKEKCEDLLGEAAKVLMERVQDGKYSESLAVLTLSKKPEWVIT